MSDLPPPLVPEDCDLQDFPFMPMEVARLRSSDLAAMETPAACWAGVLLWCACWHQVPAASLPDDDRVLANLAGYGRTVKAWKRVRAGALRGFTKASDGRLYHRTVAEKALEAWLEKLAQRLSSGEGNAKRWGTTFDRSELDGAIIITACLLRELNPQSRALKKIPTRSRPDPDPMPPRCDRESRPNPEPIARDKEGTGKGQGGGERTAPPTPRPVDLLGRELRRRGLSSAPQAIGEWSDFLQGACKIKNPDETPRALDLIFEAAKREGVVVGYSKHAAVFAEHVARTLKTERKARGAA